MDSVFKKTSELSGAETRAIKEFVVSEQPFRLYFDAALRDLARGIDNRRFCFDGAGLVMGIEFDGLSVYSTIGRIPVEVIEQVVALPGRLELHFDEEYASLARAHAGSRIARDQGLKYYSLERDVLFSADALVPRLLRREDLPAVREFYSANYRETIFSDWMLDNPFVGLFVDSRLVSAGGVVVLDPVARSCNVGNFLTARDSRGRGYSKIVVRALVNRLIEQGIREFTLGTTEENIPAWKVYESLGFRLIGRKREIEMEAVTRSG